MTTMLLFPGDVVPELPTPQKTNTALKVGPGLTYTPPDKVVAHRVGELHVDDRKCAVWMEGNGKRYIPSLNDAVIATVLRSTSDSYILAIPSSTSPAPASIQALLPHLAFPQATKKTRPILHPGCTVYARVSLANKHMDPELECYDAESQKAEGFGELKGGMVFNVSLGMARRLLGDGKKIRQLQLRARKAEGTEAEGGEISNGMEVLEELGRVLAFEIAVGRNGRVWVDSEDTKVTLCVGSCIQKSEYLTGDEQRALVREALRKL
ncbi:hypothetical protein P167DRAFT_556334 [Morchella conica CCBAS932]|uniref:Ribosomal RNA-processing protein 40 n=2 Tax=Morchella sect. Distantes TaxID=1051054 RepID=A0A3N4L317_9PEZI|nr:hypothetical protein P167DRAFT_556334 [Morchella conica CCBAS932]